MIQELSGEPEECSIKKSREGYVPRGMWIAVSASEGSHVARNEKDY